MAESDSPMGVGIHAMTDQLLDKHRDQPAQEDAPEQPVRGEEEEVDAGADNSTSDVEPDPDQDDQDLDDFEEEEDSGETEQSDSDEEEEEDKPEPIFTVKDEETGEEIPVTAEEAKAGYMRYKDYTKKRQAESQELQEVRQEREQLNAQREQGAQLLHQLAVQADSELREFANVDWAKLQEEDPYEFDEKARKYNALKLQREKASEQRDVLRRELQQIYQEELQAVKKEQEEKLALEIAEFDPHNGGPEYRAKLSSFAAEKYGFSQEQVDAIIDARMLKVLHDAFQGSQLQSRVEKGKGHAKRGKHLTPQGKKSPGNQNRRKVQELRSRSKQTGKLDDALNYVMGSMSGKKQ